MNVFKLFSNKTVIVTGHTGFKGSWLSLWLLLLGAKVIGISKSVPTKPSNFQILNLKKKIIDKRIDLNDQKKIEKLFKLYKPDFIFHLAAQALVRKSYISPIETYHSNTIGTLNILESLRVLKKKCAVVLITSDKVYKNIETHKGYKENDILGGKDPYSGSKVAAENIIASYLSSFFDGKKSKVLICVARAGNVIGGGDWSSDRVIPDCVKSWSKNKIPKIRNPNSTRPWQHVLEAVGGYLVLGSNLFRNKNFHGQSFNFGPVSKKNYKVIELLESLKSNWKDKKWYINKKSQNLFESKLLSLDVSKAKRYLKWSNILSFEEITKLTAEWYKNYYENKFNIFHFSTKQIYFYEKCVKERLKIK